MHIDNIYNIHIYNNIYLYSYVNINDKVYTYIICIYIIYGNKWVSRGLGRTQGVGP